MGRIAVSEREQNTPAKSGFAGGSAASSATARVIPSSPLARIAAATQKQPQPPEPHHQVQQVQEEAPSAVPRPGSWLNRGFSQAAENPADSSPAGGEEKTSAENAPAQETGGASAKTPPAVAQTPKTAPSFAAIAARVAAASRQKPEPAVNSAQPALSEEQAHKTPGVEHKDADGMIHPQQVREMQESFAEMTRPIVLIGPMAAGKTYIGTHLARFYGYEFLDADQLIVERYGEVSEIFEIFGEAHFRELEVKVIEEVLTSPAYRNTVFSLGGGAPMTDTVAQLLRGQNVVYILVDAPTVEPRITGSKTRPLLQPNPVQRWSEIFEHRRERYESLATYTLDARGARPIGVMAAEIQSFVLASRKENLKHDRG